MGFLEKQTGLPFLNQQNAQDKLYTITLESSLYITGILTTCFQSPFTNYYLERLSRSGPY